MSQAEKLMYELSHNCGIDFNNTRRALAVEIIERAFEAVGKEPVMPVVRQIVEPSPGGTFAQYACEARPETFVEGGLRIGTGAKSKKKAKES